MKNMEQCGTKAAGIFGECEEGTICIKENDDNYECRPSTEVPPADWEGALFPTCGSADKSTHALAP